MSFIIKYFCINSLKLKKTKFIIVNYLCCNYILCSEIIICMGMGYLCVHQKLIVTYRVHFPRFESFAGFSSDDLSLPVKYDV